MLHKKFITLLGAILFLNTIVVSSTELEVDHDSYSFSGQTFNYAHYKPSPDTSYNIVCTYPLGQFEELIAPLFIKLQQRGFHVWAAETKYRDYYGRPVKSYSGWLASSDFAAGQTRCHIDSFDTFLGDLEFFVSSKVNAREDDGKHYYFVGSSTGANLIVRFLQESSMASLFSKSALLVPMLGIRAFTWYKRLYAYSMYYTGFHRCYPIGQSDIDPALIATFADDPANTKTSDTDKLRALGQTLSEHKTKALGGPTAGWVVAADESCHKIFQPAAIGRVKDHPFLVLIAKDDATAPRGPIDKFLNLVPTAKSHVLPGRHYMHLEQDSTVARMLELVFGHLPNPRA